MPWQLPELERFQKDSNKIPERFQTGSRHASLLAVAAARARMIPERVQTDSRNIPDRFQADSRNGVLAFRGSCQS